MIRQSVVRGSDKRSVIRRFRPRKCAPHVMSDYAALIRPTILKEGGAASRGYFKTDALQADSCSSA